MTTNENIKKVALKLFASDGYNGTSLEDIAREVGIRKSSIYSHFKSKEDLYFYVLDDALLSNINSFQNLIKNFSDYTIKENLHMVFEYYCSIYADDSNTEIIFINRAVLFPPEVLKERIQQKLQDHEKKYTEILTYFFERGIESKIIKNADINDILATFYCLVDGLFVESRYYARHEYISRFNSIWNLVWEAIRN